SYLFIEDEPAELRKACRSFADRDDDVLFITSGNVKAVKEVIRNDKMKVLAVSEKQGANYINGSRIGSVTSLMTSFAASVKRPVIAIDDLLSLIQLNDLNSILTMIHQTVNSGSGITMTLLVSLRPDNLTERDKGLLLHDLQEYDMKGSQ
ncbi:MAG: DUF835 domain-containing protein, partial [Methanomassiliicoccaceae archaeon]|nr:DUF835 domain-containing protein [Methanomassiliicoccaceae archaeon]